MKLYKTIKKIFILLIVFISLQSAFSQPIYFSNRYNFDLPYVFDFARNIMEVNNGYIVAGETGYENYSNWHKLAIMKIDTLGNKLWTKTYGDTLAEYGFGYGGSLIKTIDNDFASSGIRRAYTPDWVHDQGILIKYNNDFDTLWSRLYGEKTQPYDTSYLFYQLKQLEDGCFVIIGGRKPYGLASWVYLLKTDSLGNKIWDHVYGTGGTRYYYAYSVVQTSDGGFAIGGEYAILGQYQSEQPIIIKIDSLGNQEWIETFGSQFNEFRTVVTLSNDGKITAGCILSDSSFGSTSYIGRIRIFKLTNYGSIIWDNLYGERKRNSKIHSIRTLQDGSIISSGYYVTDNYPHIVGWILKVNSDGDSIWMREYDHANLSIYSYNGLFDVKPTSDGGLIACGDIHPHPPDTGNQDAWVIKLDSIGCDTPGCDTTVAIPEILYKNTEGKLYIYPNPASNFLNIQYPITNDESKKIISIYDFFGRKVKEIKVPNTQQQIKFDVSNWNNGLYVAVLRKNKKNIVKKKFVVLR